MSRYLKDALSSNLELVQFKERKCKNETMARGYYIHNAIAEKEPLERWENEGGRLGQSVFEV